MAPRVSDRVRGNAVAIAFATLAAIGLAGCGIGAPEEGAPTPTPVASQDVSGTIELSRGVVETALRRLELGLIVPTIPFRPAESTALIDVPRGVYQAVLAGDPDGGFIAIYEFPDPAAAYDAGRAQAAWLGSGPGAIQNRAGTSHVLRQVGNTLVVYGYRPDGPSGSRAVDVATALESIGQGIAIPR
jgi:hypothetical protein